jgi:Family of unknown function (DUF6065)
MLSNHGKRIVLSAYSRAWIDDLPSRFTHHCLPLSIANSHGWGIINPRPIEISWHGETAKGDLKVRRLVHKPTWRTNQCSVSTRIVACRGNGYREGQIVYIYKLRFTGLPPALKVKELCHYSAG